MGKQNKIKMVHGTAVVKPPVPADFAELIADAGSQALWKWARQNGHKDIAELLDSVHCIRIYEQSVETHGGALDFEAKEIMEHIQTVARIVGTLGVMWEYGAEEVCNFDALETPKP